MGMVHGPSQGVGMVHGPSQGMGMVHGPSQGVGGPAHTAKRNPRWQWVLNLYLYHHTKHNSMGREPSPNQGVVGWPVRMEVSHKGC